LCIAFAVIRDMLQSGRLENDAIGQKVLRTLW
jgi:hypothetical protein